MSRLLFLSRWLPYPPANGSKLRIYNLLRGLAAHHEVTLISFAEPAEAGRRIPELEAICREVHLVPRKQYRSDGWQARLGYLSLAPRSVVDTFSPEMRQRIEGALTGVHYDAVIASQVDMAAYSPCFRGRPALFEEVEVAVLREQYSRATSTQQRLRYGLTWAKHGHFLARLLSRFQACTVASELEKQLLAQAVPAYRQVEVLPNCLNLADYQEARRPPEPDSLIFAGAFTYEANYEAMRWFVQEVYPLVQREAPAVRLTITGDHANRPLPPAANVILTGFVEDVRPLVARSWVSLAPIWSGGGTRLKILEAMALGTPVVATSKGAEGLAARHDEHLLMADTPADFAQAVVRLLHDGALRRRLADNAYRLVREQYNWAGHMPRFLSLIDHLTHTGTRLAAPRPRLAS